MGVRAGGQIAFEYGRKQMSVPRHGGGGAWDNRPQGPRPDDVRDAADAHKGADEMAAARGENPSETVQYECSNTSFIHSSGETSPASQVCILLINLYARVHGTNSVLCYDYLCAATLVMSTGRMGNTVRFSEGFSPLVLVLRTAPQMVCGVRLSVGREASAVVTSQTRPVRRRHGVDGRWAGRASVG